MCKLCFKCFQAFDCIVNGMGYLKEFCFFNLCYYYAIINEKVKLVALTLLNLKKE